MSFSFGTPKTATGFTLPTTSQATTAAGTGFQFNAGSGDNKLTSNLFGATPTTSATTLSFGLTQQKTSAPAPTLNLIGSTTQSTPVTPTLNLTSKGLAPGSIPTATTTLASILKTPATTSVTTTNVPTTASSFSLGPTPTLGVTTSSTATTATPLIATTTSIAQTTAIVQSPLTFSQLEDSIIKWTVDLEEQAKFFINQAKQLNAWDSLLISNGEKILNVNSSIERVKQQQTQLDQELDFILAQQKELEELIGPLEKELADVPVTDIDRNQMYQFAEIIDSQLKQMADDLKDIIENINEAHKDEEVSNPITQIGKILNAHMNSLQWIDRNTAQISSHLEEISKIEEANRRNLNFNSPLSM